MQKKGMWGQISAYFLNFGRNRSQFSFASVGSLASSLFIIRTFSDKSHEENISSPPIHEKENKLKLNQIQQKILTTYLNVIYRMHFIQNAFFNNLPHLF